MWALAVDRISRNTTDFSWPYGLSISAALPLCRRHGFLPPLGCSPRSPTAAPSVGLETRLATLTPLRALLPLGKLTPKGYVPQVSLEAPCPQEDLCWSLLFSYIMLLITSTVFTINLVSLIFFFLWGDYLYLVTKHLVPRRQRLWLFGSATVNKRHSSQMQAPSKYCLKKSRKKQLSVLGSFPCSRYSQTWL